MIRFEDLTEKDQENISELVDKILAYKVIPIIGYELYSELANKNVASNGIITVNAGPIANIDEITKYDAAACKDEDFFKWFAKKLISNNGAYSAGTSIGLLEEAGCEGMDYINACYRAMRSTERYTKFGDEIKRVYRTENLGSEIPGSIIKVALISHFRFYIDATVFRHIESAIKIYKPLNEASNLLLLGPKQMVINASEVFNEYSKPIDDIQPLLRLEKTIVWNLFGNYDDPNESIVNITDIHYQEVLYEYIQKQWSSGYNSLRDLFKQVDFLFIGCSFNDWIFRFILRFLRNAKLEGELNGNIVDELLRMEKDPSRNTFISQSQLRNFKMSSLDFVDILFSQISERLDGKIAFKHSCRVFISFVKEDRAYALATYTILKISYAIDCYLDERDIQGGSVLSKEIEEAIRESSVFIPIISNSFVAAKVRQSFAFAEWLYAITTNKENKTPAIMPLFVPGYDHTQIGQVPEGYEKLLNPGGFLGGVFQNKLSENFVKAAIEPGISNEELKKYTNEFTLNFLPPAFINEVKKHQENCMRHG